MESKNPKIDIKDLDNLEAVSVWLGLKPTQSNKEMVEETVVRFLYNSDDDGGYFNESPRSEFEIVEWVADNLDLQYESLESEDRKTLTFVKKLIKSLWSNYRFNAEFKSLTRQMEQYDFIEKIVEDEQAKTLPEGTKSWSTTSSGGRGYTVRKVVKDGKWVRE